MPTNVQLSSASLNCQSILDRADHPHYGLVSAYIVGDLLGTLDDSGLINRHQSSAISYVSELIQRSDDFGNISLLPFVGAFSIVIILHDKAEIFLCVSCTCPSPYVYNKDNIFVVEFDENKLLKKHKYDLSVKSLLNISNATLTI